MAVSCLIKACKNISHLEQIHAHIIRKGLEQDHSLVTQFISVCCNLNSSSSTCNKITNYTSTVFNRVLLPNNIYLWNTLINSHSSSLPTSINLFRRMMQQQTLTLSPDRYTFPSLLKACSNAFALTQGQLLHALIVKFGTESDVYVASSLIDLYGKCSQIVSARKVFDGMPVRNEVTWTSIIVAYSSHANYLEAKKLFDKMPQRNLNSWNVIINVFIKSGDFSSAKLLFDEMPCKNTVSFTTMIDGYAKSGDMASARSLFDQSPEKDIVSWSAMINGYTQNGQPKEAIKLFIDMCSRNIKPDEYVMASLISACSQAGDWELAKWVDSYMTETSTQLNKNNHVAAALVDMNAKCGNLERAASLFKNMPKRDLVSYCSMIQGLSVHGQSVQAVALFHKMLEEGLRPDDVAVTVILDVCVHADLVEEGCNLFNCLISKYSLVPNTDHYACIVNLLGRAGKLKEAYYILDKMPVESHSGAWGALLWACRVHGDVSLGKEVAGRLFKIEPKSGANYVLLSDMYAASDQWSDVNYVRNQMSVKGIRKLRGCSWI